jgi:hypothetical protein
MIKNGKIWPILIATAIFGVVLLSYWTIKETAQADLSKSNLYLGKYQDVDENINDIIAKQIAFNKEYTIKLEDFDLAKENGFIRYSLMTKDGKPVNDAKMVLVLSRPINDAKDITLKPSKVENGSYIFSNITLPKKGRWDFILEVKVKDKSRYYNIKADTRKKKTTEY